MQFNDSEKQLYWDALVRSTELMLTPKEKDLIAKGEKINAIKEFLERSRCGLRESKTIIEAYMDSDELKKVSIAMNMKEVGWLRKVLEQNCQNLSEGDYTQRTLMLDKLRAF